MNMGRARAILGLTEAADETSIAAAYRRAVRAAHPDTGGHAAYSIAEARDARDCLLNLKEMRAAPCKMCAGRGHVAGRACVQCGGSGEQP